MPEDEITAEETRKRHANGPAATFRKALSLGFTGAWVSTNQTTPAETRDEREVISVHNAVAVRLFVSESVGDPWKGSVG